MQSESLKDDRSNYNIKSKIIKGTKKTIFYCLS